MREWHPSQNNEMCEVDKVIEAMRRSPLVLVEDGYEAPSVSRQVEAPDAPPAWLTAAGRQPPPGSWGRSLSGYGPVDLQSGMGAAERPDGPRYP